MGYGPDNNLQIDWGRTIQLKVPRYAQVKLTFSAEAAWENAICIYDSAYNKIFEKGNQAGRNLNPEVYGRNRVEERMIFITGWHKNGPADGGKPWYQSACRFSPNAGDNFGSGVIGFEDGGDGDYNDIMVSYVFE
ncbi:hypothetical protein VRU48_14235 [Pedobacter sp. KR3-3]|uniref:DUF4114 domain-containing protein n=1 Tax=Pedobacter albus TaxID=3113905 RepID=A0ABU7IA95_9SPHI|nr:hypothetical protein [Pedobacter sp. KR3-3]MEE1946279.1 hypothetical protein [Pedobacter sp. KR3-3]